jgi:hypothetical protein
MFLALSIAFIRRAVAFIGPAVTAMRRSSPVDRAAVVLNAPRALPVGGTTPFIRGIVTLVAGKSLRHLADHRRHPASRASHRARRGGHPTSRRERQDKE